MANLLGGKKRIETLDWSTSKRYFYCEKILSDFYASTEYYNISTNKL
ncbi:MAG: hypothetical protein K9G63_02415 [Melioribacteraceae bacterium]|nr:hypothetical protein [Melioribacteraceae bacterium]